MLTNYLKLAFRNISKHKSFSIINIAGLTLGLTACMLIGLFVWDEYRFDKTVANSNQVYRIYSEYKNTDGTQMMAVTPPAFAPTLQKDFPEVESTVRIMMQPEAKRLFEAGNAKIYEASGYIADSTFFNVFPLSLKYGTVKSCMDAPSSIILSDEFAQRLFGNENPVGKQVLMDKGPFKVTAVFKKDDHFHLRFNYLIPMSNIYPYVASRMESWVWHQFITYVKLKTNANVQALQTKFGEEVTRLSKSEPGKTATDKPFFQSLKDVHLYSSDFKFDVAVRGNIVYVRALTIIAVFVLLIACFNFINLATAKSLQRAKEVGVRKTIGAGKRQLVAQFISETVLFAFISTFIAVLLSVNLLPWLNSFTGKNISLTIFLNPMLILLLLGLSLAVGIVAGFYPALVLSNFKPVKVLKGSPAGNVQGDKIPWLRHSLVVLQFTLSALLIISAIIVFKQVNYLHNKDLGFNKEQILFFPMRGDKMTNNVDAFKNELAKAPGVSSVSIGYGFPGDAVAGDEIIVNKNGQQVSQSATQLAVDFDYIRTLGLEVIAGRDFSTSMGTDKDHAWIINETAVKTMGFETPQKALGQTLSWHIWGANNDSLKTGQIIGVVKDFHYKSLYDKVETTVLQIFPGAAWKVAVKINTANAGNTINAVKNVWTKFSPEYPIEYKFLDENFEQMYNSEDKLRSLLAIFTSIAIFVGCLGLFGLAAYTAERRKKEIGIRKVLGASTNSVVILLSKDFIRLVCISLLLASPIAWYYMNQWLQDFAYRISISGWIFIIAASIVLGIALITVSLQAIRAAMMKPVKSLRTE
ncbi:MAG: ABC transporter permease [Chitinophagaceae bacterium]